MGRVRLKRGVPAVWALNAALAAVALALYHHVGGLPAPVAAVAIPWWALALAFAITEISVVHVHFRRSSHTLALGELPLIVGLLFCSPGEVMLAWVAGAALVLLATPASASRSASSSTLPSWPSRPGSPARSSTRCTGDGAALGPIVWVAATLAVLIAVAVSVLLVNAAMWVSGRRHRAA